ncbi:MAG: MBL fold metallo-hydrolase [Erysipelotrichaceae bacterium]|nr:MBL fold metallo-hydrolase [Erysipelotrichaceae bacterium]
MLEIRALGGSGEDSRNCFLVSWDDHSILLDCGVRREIADVSVVYPALNDDIAEKLDAVILSHAHEDHTAALPYLYHLGYTGNVYATAETISQTPGFMKKWYDYAFSNDALIPYDPQDIEKVRFHELSEAPSFLVNHGRSGHMLGSQWYLFSVAGKRILYTGDITYEGLLLETDSLPECDILIIDCAYASRNIIQKKSYEKLARLAEKTLGNGGHLLLPVPANGRGIDMYLHLLSHGFNILVDAAIIKNTDKLRSETGWIRETDLWRAESDNVTIIKKENIIPDKPSVILVPDGMMTTARSKAYYELIKNDKNSRIVITGHSAKGTLANSLQDQEYRRDNKIAVKVDNLTIKVHLDERDVLKTVRMCKPERVVLFHARKENCRELIEKLREMKIETLCSTEEKMTVI